MEKKICEECIAVYAAVEASRTVRIRQLKLKATVILAACTEKNYSFKFEFSIACSEARDFISRWC